MLRDRKGANHEMYYKDILKAMKKQLDRFNIKSQTLKNQEDCEDIVNKFNNSCYLKSEEEDNLEK